VQVADLEHAALTGAVVARLGALLDVAPRAKCLLAGSGEDDGLHLAVGPREPEGLDELVNRAGTECVVALRTFDRDDGGRVLDGVVDVFELTHRNPLSVRQSERLAGT
jgi:hypothetical protein